MVPASVFGVVTFLIFVVPGTLFELLRDRTRPPREESTFIHISRVLLSGTLITSISLLLLVLVGQVNPTSVLDLSKLLTQGTKYLSTNLGTVGWTLAVQLVASSLMAIIASDIRTQSSSPVIHQGNAWQMLGERIAREKQLVKVNARLKSGRDLLGYYVGASTDLDPAKRELIIGAPISSRTSEDGKTVPMGHKWQRLAVPGAEIEFVAFAYEGETRPEPASYTLRDRLRSWAQGNYLGWRPATFVLATLLIVAFVI